MAMVFSILRFCRPFLNQERDDMISNVTIAAASNMMGAMVQWLILGRSSAGWN
jgi:membrane protein YqaA with SNARE-associated domain